MVFQWMDKKGIHNKEHLLRLVITPSWDDVVCFKNMWHDLRLRECISTYMQS